MTVVSWRTIVETCFFVPMVFVVQCSFKNGHFQILGDRELATALWCADSLMQVLHDADTFLTMEEQNHRKIVGEMFMFVYVRLAAKAADQNKKMFRTRPKLHMMHHIILESRASNLNPVTGSTWMDEDAIKRYFQVKKRVHRKTAALNCLRRWLLGLPVQFRRVLKRP